MRLATPDSVEETLRELQTYCRGTRKISYVMRLPLRRASRTRGRSAPTTSFAGYLIWLGPMIATSVGPWTRLWFLQLWLLSDNYCSRALGRLKEDPVIVRRDVVRQVAKMLLKPKNKGAFSTNPAVEEDEGRRGRRAGPDGVRKGCFRAGVGVFHSRGVSGRCF